MVIDGTGNVQDLIAAFDVLHFKFFVETPSNDALACNGI